METKKSSFDTEDPVDSVLGAWTTFPMMTGKPWLLGLLGAVEFIMGTVLLAFPLGTGLMATWIIGVIFIALGILQFVYLFNKHTKGKVWGVFSMLLYFIIGAYSMKETVEALSAWTLFLGIYFLVTGIGRTSLALALKGTKGWGWTLFSAFVTLVLGAWVTFGWPETSVWVVGPVIAVELLLSGWTMILMSIASSGASKKDA